MVKRLLTFAIVTPIVFLFIYYDLPPYGILPFLVLMSGVGVLATNEYFTVTSRYKGNPHEIIGYLIVLVLIISTYMKETSFFWNSYLGAFLAVFTVGFFCLEMISNRILSPDNQALLVVRGILYVGFLYSYFVLIRNLDKGFAYLIFVALTIAALDTAAYVIGIKYGKHKIAPSISPKKSVEGSIAGLVAAVLAATILGTHYLGFTHSVVMGIIIGTVGQLGDLFESKLKRVYEVKDSGWLLPGHGGIMDRLDSAAFTVPLIYYYIVMVIN